MGTGGVGDPRFVARNLPIVALFDGTGAQGPKVGARVWLSKNGGRQSLGGGQSWEPFLFLLFGAAAKDQFGCDLGAGAEGAYADVAARQFFGHHAHGGFRQAKAAVFFGDGQAENAHFGEFIDDFHRNKFIFEMPVVRKWLHFFDTKAAELLADHLKFVVKTRGTNGGIGGVFLHQFHKTCACTLRAPAVHQAYDIVRHLSENAHVVQADHLALVHLDAAVNLGQIFTECDLMDQLLGLAELAVRSQAFGPCLHLLQRLGVGGKPRDAMRGGLIGLDQRRGDAVAVGHKCADI